MKDKTAKELKNLLASMSTLNETISTLIQTEAAQGPIITPPEKPRSKYDPEQLKKGMDIESEHTKDENLAANIAMNHLDEDPDYYKKLDIMEKTELQELKNKSAEAKESPMDKETVKEDKLEKKEESGETEAKVDTKNDETPGEKEEAKAATPAPAEKEDSEEDKKEDEAEDKAEDKKEEAKAADPAPAEKEDSEEDKKEDKAEADAAPLGITASSPAACAKCGEATINGVCGKCANGTDMVDPNVDTVDKKEGEKPEVTNPVEISTKKEGEQETEEEDDDEEEDKGEGTQPEMGMGNLKAALTKVLANDDLAPLGLSEVELTIASGKSFIDMVKVVASLTQEVVQYREKAKAAELERTAEARVNELKELGVALDLAAGSADRKRITSMDETAFAAYRDGIRDFSKAKASEIKDEKKTNAFDEAKASMASLSTEVPLVTESRRSKFAKLK